MKRIIIMLISSILFISTLCFPYLVLHAEDDKNIEDDNDVEINEEIQLEEQNDISEEAEIVFEEDDAITKIQEIEETIEDESDNINNLQNESLNGDTDNSEMSIISSGSCGENVNYTIYEDYSMVISGIGAITSTPCTREYRDKITSLKIENGITSICNEAFNVCSSLETVIFGSDVNIIGEAICRRCRV